MPSVSGGGFAASSEPAVVFVGPEVEAQQVAALLAAKGVCARVHSQVGGLAPWTASGPYDSRVVVGPSDAARARRFLEKSPRWKPVDAETDEQAASNVFSFFVAALVVVGVVGLVLIIGVLLH